MSETNPFTAEKTTATTPANHRIVEPGMRRISSRPDPLGIKVDLSVLRY